MPQRVGVVINCGEEERVTPLLRSRSTHFHRLSHQFMFMAIFF